MGPQKERSPSLIDDGLEPGLVSVGRQIKAQRQASGMREEELAATLHMGVEQLRALEAGNADELPEPVFIKAMVRRLAARLRLDADALVGELGTMTQPSGTVGLLASPPANRFKRSASASNRSRRPVLVLLPVILLCGGAGITFWQFNLNGAPQSESPKPDVQPLIATPPIEQRPAGTTTPEPSAKPLAPPQHEATPDVVEISSTEPSWIALRRGDTIEFQGILDEPRVIKNPESVEIYAGRPDLVTVNMTNASPRTVGQISDLRWHKVISER